ncbi:hypothetical protein LQV63_15775 [Paenibacillus profundus]|uniref:Uncharacterized protein n=1 Tax=Paenibacillus profundus TaxID=1173085 RepID=A0ABS8YFI8_9BACL|nr:MULTISPECIES: hypothetical protein [Paenibacillus]MCE5170765.1 hypothetical protein [Paenibacillus profundus]MCM3342509.1 hypothetical protein [Paenibacillus sp. MER TA 81-3]
MPWHLFDEWGGQHLYIAQRSVPGAGRIFKVKPVQTKMNGCIMHTFTGSSQNEASHYMTMERE